MCQSPRDSVSVLLTRSPSLGMRRHKSGAPPIAPFGRGEREIGRRESQSRGCWLVSQERGQPFTP